MGGRIFLLPPLPALCSFFVFFFLLLHPHFIVPFVCRSPVYSPHFFVFAISLHFSFGPPLGVCPPTSCSPPVQSQPRLGLKLPALCRPLCSLTRRHSLQPMRAEKKRRGGEMSGAHLELCHCPPEQTTSWGSREGEKLVGRPSTNCKGEWGGGLAE